MFMFISMSKWQVRLIACISGAIAVLAFAPFSIWPLAILSLAVLFYLFLVLPQQQTVMVGYFYGLGFFGVGVSWVFNSIYEFGQAAVPVAVIITLGFVLILSCYPALVAWCFNFWRRKGLRGNTIFILPALWVLSEWLRAWVLTGFPWMQMGYSQLHTPLSGMAPILGALGVSWLVATIAILLARSVMPSPWSRYRYLLLIVGVVGIGLVTSFLDQTRVAGESVRVTLVQGNIAQENKWEPDWLRPTIDRYTEHTLAHLDSRLVVWPEVALPGYHQQFETVLQPLVAKAAASGTSIITGTLTAEDNKAYNSVVLLSETPATEASIYRKRHLVPFGEYLPFADLIKVFGSLVVLPAGNMGAGQQANIIFDGDLKIASSICYEDAYGNEMADMLPEANVLLNVSNDAWFGDSFAPHQHLEIAQMRALELGREMMRANNTGITAFIDHRGKVRQRAAQFEVVAISDTITPRAGRTLYVLWENYGVVVLMLLVLLLSAVLPARQSSSKL